MRPNRAFTLLAVLLLLTAGVLACGLPGAPKTAPTAMATTEPTSNPTPSPSPSSEPIWTTYRTGGPVIDITFDQEGILWAAIGKGVSRFDGNKWATYAADAWNVQITSVALAPDGALWAGTTMAMEGDFYSSQGEGAFRFGSSASPAAGGEAWAVYTIRDGLIDDSVRDIATGLDGTLWFATESGISRFDGETWASYTAGDGLVQDTATSIAIGPDGSIWVGAPDGISRFDGGAWEAYPFSVRLWPTGIAAAPDGTLWISSDIGITHLDANGNVLKGYNSHNTNRGLAADEVHAVTVAPDGIVWAGTVGGVARFDGKTWTTYTTEDGLAADEVHAIAVAPDGALWFGTADGISRYGPPGPEQPSGGSPVQPTVIPIPTPPTHPLPPGWTAYTISDGLASNGIRFLVAAPDGTLWCGTEDRISRGLSRFDGETWITYPIDDRLGELPSLPGSSAASNDAIWIAGDYRNGGLFRFDGEAWSWYTSYDYGLESETIWSIVTAPDGSVWISAYHAGVARFDGETWTPYTSADGLTDAVQLLAVTPDGTVLAFTDHGLLYFEDETWVTEFETEEGSIWGLAVVATLDGSLWFIGDSFRGVFQIDAWGRLTEYTVRDGLADNEVWTIAAAPDGTVWVGTPNGASQFDGERWTSYTSADGLPDDHVTAIAVTPDGAVWFGTPSGLVRYQP